MAYAGSTVLRVMCQAWLRCLPPRLWPLPAGSGHPAGRCRPAQVAHPVAVVSATALAARQVRAVPARPTRGLAVAAVVEASARRAAAAAVGGEQRQVVALRGSR